MRLSNLLLVSALSSLAFLSTNVAADNSAAQITPGQKWPKVTQEVGRKYVAFEDGGFEEHVYPGQLQKTDTLIVRSSQWKELGRVAITRAATIEKRDSLLIVEECREIITKYQQGFDSDLAPQTARLGARTVYSFPWDQIGRVFRYRSGEIIEWLGPTGKLFIKPSPVVNTNQTLISH